jgi:iron complex outermembrane receptor protein
LLRSFVVVLAAGVGSAQDQIMKASIQGRVQDPHGLAVPGADVVVLLAERERSWASVTDESGSYSVYGLSPGQYRVEIKMPGFKEFESEPLELRSGETLRLDVGIQLPDIAERVTVTPSRFQRRSDYSSPATFITDEEIAGLNTPTVEDVFNYQPSVTIRRRYIGDSNGTIGIRGANMFQTARAMVFADGVPLHNPMQTRWNGAPRWSLVAPDEVLSAEVIYGPFSAEHSGNAMGGVVKLTTKLPESRQLSVDGNLFSQRFAFDGSDDDFNGGRLFVSYGDRIGKLGFQVFYNRLSNASQPQNFNRDDAGLAPAADEPVVSGAFRSVNELENPAVTYGDTGAEAVESNLFKFKGGYELSPEWDTRLTLAYENRNDDRDRQLNYLQDSAGLPIWGDGNDATTDAQFGGEAFNVRNDLFGVSSRTRESLFVGWELRGRLSGDWYVNTTVSRFDILQDEAVDSAFNPRDPLDNDSGVITAFDDSGWTTVDLKLDNPVFLGNYDLSLVTGYHFSAQQIELNQYSSLDYRNATQDAVSGRSGGKTALQGLYAQLGWRFLPDWELTLGGREELWSTRDGFAETPDASVEAPERDLSRFSPKFSLGWEPASRVRIQYSLARAYRFPVPEELFDNQIRTFGTVLGDASLEPEAGAHHNLSVQYGLGSGHIEANWFRDDVKDTIFTQFQFVGGAPIFSFLPVDRVLTHGLELVVNQPGIMGSRFDLQVNATVVESTIQEHTLRPSWVGNDFPRMPRLRLGLVAVYHANPRWLVSLAARYSSNQFGDLGNADTAENVFGAIDAYLFLDTKISYQLPTGGRFSFGVNNLTNDGAFVFHPWPHRTFFAEFGVNVGRDLLGSGS